MRGGTAERRSGGTIVPLDVERVQQDFPILSRTSRGRRLAYLDSAATAQKPPTVTDCRWPKH